MNYGELVDRLANFVTSSQGERDENQSYYNSEYRVKALGVNIPPEMEGLLAQIGWPRLYLDSIEHRLDVEGFRMGGDDAADKKLWNWWVANGLDVESSMAH